MRAESQEPKKEKPLERCFSREAFGELLYEHPLA
jgi:hypothetical protein